jgi:hypothetical protein
MIKKVPFGNGDGLLLDSELKQKAIDYLYSSLDLSKFRYIILTTVQKLKYLQENEHYVSPNFKGYNYLLLMFTVGYKHYAVAIDRKKLSYHKDQLDMKTIGIIQINMNISETLYSGTIFDGKLIQTANGSIFLIQDCFYLMGKKMLEMEMTEKMTHLDSVLKSHFKKEKNKNIYCSNFEFKLNKLYTYMELESMIKNMTNLSIETTGIVFYPKFSGITNIYVDKKTESVDKITIGTNNKEIIESNTYHIIHDFVNFLKSRTYSYESGSKTKQFWLSRTPIPDVYDLMEKESGDKIGIALIPNLKISLMCDSLIQTTPVKFNCIFSTKFKKWIPLTPLQ